MDKLKELSKLPRFQEINLKGWSQSDLNRLTNSGKHTQNIEKVTKFRETFEIKEVLYPLEKALILSLIGQLSEESLTKVSDVHQYYQNNCPIYYSPEGLMAREMVKADAWLKPVHLETKKPSSSFVMGMTLAMTDVNHEGKMTPKADFAPLMPLKLEEVNVSGMTAVAPLVVALLEDKVKELGKVSGGRDLVDRLNDTVRELPKEDYLMLHYLLCAGPFSDHFMWGQYVSDKKSENGKTVITSTLKPLKSRKPGYRTNEVITAVKKKYENHYDDMSDCATVTAMKKAGQTILKVFLWSKGFVPKFQVPAINEQTFPIVYRFMNDCRTFRGTDEKGLSGWSCGFGNCGNPTKQQTRLQKKLTILMGAMTDPSKNGPVIVSDEMINEMPLLASQILLWKAKMGKCREVLFVTPSTSSRVNELLGPSRYNSQSTIQATHVIFPEPSVVATKASEWAKTDLQSEQLRDNIFPVSGNSTAPTPHTIYATAILSSCWFTRKDLKVYTLGSLHNMYAYVSNEDMYCIQSDGSSEFAHARIELKAASMSSFLSTVCSHNGHRNGYFLDPRYYFNAKLNMLRHIKGKQFDFQTCEVRDIVGTAQENDDMGVYEQSQSDDEIEDQEVVEEFTDSEEEQEDSHVQEEEEKDGELVSERGEILSKSQLEEKRERENSSNIVLPPTLEGVEQLLKIKKKHKLSSNVPAKNDGDVAAATTTAAANLDF